MVRAAPAGGNRCQFTETVRKSGCNDIALNGMVVQEHCEIHKIPGETNLIECRCSSCGLLGIVDSNGNCETCDPETFKRIKFAKQNLVRDFLVAKDFKFDTVAPSVGRTIDRGACGRERPDFCIVAHMLVVEVDNTSTPSARASATGWRRCFLDSTQIDISRRPPARIKVIARRTPPQQGKKFLKGTL
ncbi:hypothetical protein DFS34DRAFT_463723 [Phlyctochytrium arcticum]|nr:hypothetical protein DFS34DRAFT_463723 [Phlyctochytrium arcticum]